MKNWYKGWTAAAILLAIAGVATAAPVYAEEQTLNPVELPAGDPADFNLPSETASSETASSKTTVVETTEEEGDRVIRTTETTTTDEKGRQTEKTVETQTVTTIDRTDLTADGTLRREESSTATTRTTETTDYAASGTDADGNPADGQQTTTSAESTLSGAGTLTITGTASDSTRSDSGSYETAEAREQAILTATPDGYLYDGHPVEESGILRDADGKVLSISYETVETLPGSMTDEQLSALLGDPDYTVILEEQTVTILHRHTVTFTYREEEISLESDTSPPETVEKQHTNAENYYEKSVLCWDPDTQQFAEAENESDVQDYLHALGVAIDFDVYADSLTAEGWIDHVDGHVAVNQIAAENGSARLVIWSKEQIGNGNREMAENYQASGYSYIGSVAAGSRIEAGSNLGSVHPSTILTEAGSEIGQQNVRETEILYLEDGIASDTLLSEHPELTGYEQTIRIEENLDTIAEKAAAVLPAETTSGWAEEKAALLQAGSIIQSIEGDTVLMMDLDIQALLGNGYDNYEMDRMYLQQLVNRNTNGATLLINVTGLQQESYVLRKWLNNGIQNYDPKAAYLIWNFGDYAGELDFQAGFCGVVVAANASLNLRSGIESGSVIARSVRYGSYGGELHFAFKDGTASWTGTASEPETTTVYHYTGEKTTSSQQTDSIRYSFSTESALTESTFTPYLQDLPAPVDLDKDDPEQPPTDEPAPVDLDEDDPEQPPTDEPAPVDLDEDDPEQPPTDEPAPVDLDEDDPDEPPTDEPAPVDPDEDTPEPPAPPPVVWEISYLSPETIPEPDQLDEAPLVTIIDDDLPMVSTAPAPSEQEPPQLIFFHAPPETIEDEVTPLSTPPATGIPTHLPAGVLSAAVAILLKKKTRRCATCPHEKR